MGIYYDRGVDIIFLQDLHGSIASYSFLMKSKNLTSSILYGGALALCLSYLIAQFFSSSLFAFYHDWKGWRSLTGSSPNMITQALSQISWALLFCISWWMIWRLDLFISTESKQLIKDGSPQEDSPNTFEKEQDHNSNKMDEPQRSENFIPEDFDEDPPQDTTKSPGDPQFYEQAKKVHFPTIEELEMAELLGLSKDELEDFSKIKTTYRNVIAQYHPDKVSALGAEIREVAEKKAKEINQAYEYFRKKFKNH